MGGGTDDERALPGDRDPAAGRVPSALTVWLWLAGIGAVFCAVAAALLFRWLPQQSWVAWVLVALAVIAAADFCWIAQRERRGGPG